ncbi:MAG: indolepyruvate oxidoreductase subunit beta [Victivallaceae bacterium]|nr:indolepyruvate oxidoreductase subunit beta [Victivallaceae bacterium]
MKKVTNVIVAGLGGQGVLKLTDILADVLFHEGYDVKKSEVHGMSQRGGSVSSEIRFGEEIASPMIPEGEADLLVSLDSTQTQINLHRLREGGTVIRPEDEPIGELSNPKCANVLMLGALSRHLDIPEQALLDGIAKFLPAKVLEMNLAAFKLGRKGGLK